MKCVAILQSPASPFGVHTRGNLIQHAQHLNPIFRRSFVPIAEPLHSGRSIKALVSLKIKDYGGLGDFDLPKEQEEALAAMLSDPSFCRHVCVTSGGEGATEAKFTGLLFQPVPWSPSTRKGMPQSMEKYYDSENHAIINVPPPLMFKAKVFQPNRLCAVFEFNKVIDN